MCGSKRRLAGNAWIPVLGLIGWMLLGGCGKSMWVTRYPDFDTAQVHTVAVLPLENQTLSAPAGQYVARRLADALQTQGNYRVLGPAEVRAILAKDDKEILSSDRVTIARRLRESGKADAFVSGSVETFASASYTYRAWQHGYGYTYYFAGPEWDYPLDLYTYNDAHISVAATLVRVADGAVLAQTPVAVRGEAFSQGDPPVLTPGECVAKATDQVAGKLVRQFAAVRKKVTVVPGRDLRTAVGKEQGKWQFADSFSAADDTMYVVLALPADCDRNTFRLEVAKPPSRAPLATLTIVWSSDEPKELKFNPRDLAAKAGSGKFTITFYSHSIAVMSRTITIRQP